MRPTPLFMDARDDSRGQCMQTAIETLWSFSRFDSFNKNKLYFQRVWASNKVKKSTYRQTRYLMLDTTNHSRQKSSFLRDFSVKKKKSNHTEIYCTNLYNTIQTYCQKNLKALRRAERGPLKRCGLNAFARRRQNFVSPRIFSLTKKKTKPHKVFLRDSVQYQPKMLSKKY